jgi:hypothetical protein
MSERAVCKCGAVIWWARTIPGGRPMPVTVPAEGQSGSLAVRRDGSGSLVCRQLKAGGELEPGEHTGRAHWADCPHAGDFRG